ncbi:maleylpyruvate isomerase N-terminal domain-containing protein [Rarobacter faecitabidus]|uniref:DinB family protein n=1 Tax=Rarobacter faecitabidus TaxID=13243 RepID=A0A542ZUF4_RARFA|nr:DinB family protein [Rarobacter faecitabidus]TQL63972.1 hypothetical protein FB461_0455 [Rarobacter faecitabidus]
MAIEPDTKDWTWVTERRCPECGFDPTQIRSDQVSGHLLANADEWLDVVRRPDAAARRDPGKWSDLEYACHVRDVHRVMKERVALMQIEDSPTFPSWDQDATALEDRYDLQDPLIVGDEIGRSARDAAREYDRVTDWSRAGLRSGGAHFTIGSIALYHLHDVVHHLWDVQ